EPLNLAADLFDADVQERDLLAYIVVQFASDALAFDFLAGDQPSGEVAVERDDPFRVGHVTDDAEDAVVASVDDTGFEVPDLVERQVVLDDHRVPTPTRAFD